MRPYLSGSLTNRVNIQGQGHSHGREIGQEHRLELKSELFHPEYANEELRASPLVAQLEQKLLVRSQSIDESRERRWQRFIGIGDVRAEVGVPVRLLVRASERLALRCRSRIARLPHAAGLH